MGLGAAASEPGTLSMLRHLYPDARARSRAIGVWAGTSGFALAMGPVIGGVLTGLWSWRAIFWFNLVFGLAVLAVAAVILPESADPTAARVDTAGTLLGAGALAAFVYAIIDSESAGFGSAVVIVLLCASAVLAAAFVWRERRAAHPLLDLRFLRVPQFTTANIAAFCTYFATFAIFFFTALYLVEVVALSGYKLALVFLPMTVLMIVSSLLAGRWTARGRAALVDHDRLRAAGRRAVPGRRLPQAQPVLRAADHRARAGRHRHRDHRRPRSPPSVLNAVPAERSGMAASATNTSREIGAVTGVAILGSLVYSQLHASLVSADESPRRAGQFPGPGHQRHRDRRDPEEHHRLLGLRQARQGGHRGRLHGVPRRAARRALPVGGAGAGRRAARLDHAALTAGRRRVLTFPAR